MALNAQNSLATGTLREMFIPDAQDFLDNMLVAKPLSEVYTGPDHILHNRYYSNPEGSDGVATVSYSVNTFTSTDDTLTVNRRAVAAEHIDSIEELQTIDSLRTARAKRHAYIIANQIDKYVLNMPVSFSGVTDLDAGSLAGGASTGVAYQITSSNADDVANTIYEDLALNNAMTDEGVDWVVSPKVKTKIVSYLQGTGNNVADDAITAGFKGLGGFTGRTISDIRVHMSNNLTHEVTLALATQPTAGDTMTLSVTGDRGREDIVITFVATLTGAAGEVHIASAVDITRANLAEFLNAYGENSEAEATDAGYTALSNAQFRALKSANITATNNNSTDTLAIVLQGTLSVSETLTDGTDAFGVVGAHTVAMVNGSTLLALPSGGMELDYAKVGGKHGKELETSQVYNSTIWVQNIPQVKDVFLYT